MSRSLQSPTGVIEMRPEAGAGGGTRDRRRAAIPEIAGKSGYP